MTKREAVQLIVNGGHDDRTIASVMEDYGIDAEVTSAPYDDRFHGRLVLLYYLPAAQRAAATRQLCRDFDLAIPAELEPRAEQLSLLP